MTASSYRTYFICLVGLSFFSCASLERQDEKEAISAIKIGMTIPEVTQLVGTPVRASHHQEDDVLLWTQSFIIFSQGRVIQKGDLSEEKSMEISSESYSGEIPKAKVAAILPANKGMTKYSLEFQQAKKLVVSLLERNRYTISEDEKKIDTVVFVNFGTRPGHSGDILYLALEAFDYLHFSKTKETRPYWKLVSFTLGAASKLRQTLPYLALAASDLVETDSGKTITRTFVDGDARLARLNEGNNGRLPAQTSENVGTK